MEFFIEIIKEEEFVPLADKSAGKLLTFAAYFHENPDRKFSKRLYVALVKETMETDAENSITTRKIGTLTSCARTIK